MCQFRRDGGAVRSHTDVDMNAEEFSGYADFEWAVQLNRFILKLIGLWPEEDGARWRLNSNLRLFSVVTAITFVCTTPSLHSLAIVWGDLTAMIDNLLFTLPLLTLSAKLLIMWWKREAFLPLLTMIMHDWIKPKSCDERDVMIRRAQNARLIIACSYSIIISTLAVLIIATGFGYNLRYVTNATDPGRPLPLQAHYVFDTFASPQFELTFLVQSVVLLIIAVSYTSINNFLGLLVFHICGQLENLTKHLHRMRETTVDFRLALKINIVDHTRLIRSVAIIENTFTLMLLLLFLYFGTVFCVYGFLVITVIFEEKNISVKRATFLIMVICTAIIHMCVYCAVGELLVAKYEKVYNAICECKWYTLETKEAKDLILLMIRTNKPLYITAGKLLPMTMSTFCSILKTSGGYISVLLANRN